jgi:glycosyltransferase involved in cell wall biosynthesis
MRIWAFPSFYPFDAPGAKWAGIFAHRQYKGLIANGADLRVVIPSLWIPPAPFSDLLPKWKQNSRYRYPDSLVYDGIQVYYPKIDNLLPNAIDKRDYRQKYFDALSALFKSLGIQPHPSTDIFYSQWLPDAYFTQYAAHRFGIKSAILSIGDDVVVWPHESPETMKAFRQLIEEADMRFACADYLGREVNKLTGKQLPYDVVRWGVDYNQFKPADAASVAALRKKYNIPEGKVAILNVGSAIVRKGWLDLLDALQNIKKKNADFCLVSVYAGPKELVLKDEAEKRGLAEHLVDLAEVPPVNLHEVFNAVDIFCLPSHWEGLANANIEAMSCGLPVITTDVCGHPELIQDGVNGMLIPAKRPDILEQKLMQLIESKELRDKLSKAGRTYIVNEWGNFADNATLLLKKLNTVG